MDLVILAGRILFVFLFASSGVGHIRQRTMMAGYAGQKGVPFPKLLVPLTGVQLLAGALLVLLGIWPDLGALLLALFLAPTALTMHAFWRLEDPAERQMDRVHFLKDVGLLGAVLMLFGLFQQFGEALDFTITGPLF